MAAYSHSLNSPNGSLHTYDADAVSPRTLPDLGPSRQAKRLQMRNAGFRGPTVPPRKATPKSQSSSDLSSTSWLNASSDAENISPSAPRKATDLGQRRQSSGILQEIGNSTAKKQKKPRSRIPSTRLFSRGLCDQKDLDEDRKERLKSPASFTVRKRSAKPHAIMLHGRRSVSSEASKYIEHLESELAATQTHLSSITSPSTTRQQSSKMRSLNAETKQLQDELAEWETRYEERVREQVDQHYAIEHDLRQRIRSLEQESEDHKYKIEELQTRLERTTENLDQVETANVNLEKRLEIMSDMLASSKVDLHAQSPGRAKRHIRPQSMLPRFPTASSLMGSPERRPQTQPPSPLATFSRLDHCASQSMSHDTLMLDHLDAHTDTEMMSEVESVFSEVSAAGDSITSAETLDTQSNRNPWTMPTQSMSKLRTGRRMRRFGAGSLGPKPLILPSTSQYDLFSSISAPPLERSETKPAFFSPQSRRIEEVKSPVQGRRRASTTANEMTIPDDCESPIQDVPNNERFGVAAEPPSPAETISSASGELLALEEPIAARNLMDELLAVRSDDSADLSIEEAHHEPELAPEPTPDFEAPSLPTLDPKLDTRPLCTTLPSTHLPSPVPFRSPHLPSLAQNPSLHTPDHARSVFDRLRLLFSHLWHSPVALTQHFVRTAQARMQIPRILLNTQWWLVGLLLGPMARRRMLTTRRCCGDRGSSPLLLDGDPAHGTGYGAMCGTPTSVERRKHSDRRQGGCCLHERRKHSPFVWLKFSLTLAFAIGVAFKDGPGSLLKKAGCACREDGISGRVEGRVLTIE